MLIGVGVLMSFELIRMGFPDWVANFTRCQIVNLTPESILDNEYLNVILGLDNF